MRDRIAHASIGHRWSSSRSFSCPPACVLKLITGPPPTIARQNIQLEEALLRNGLGVQAAALISSGPSLRVQGLVGWVQHQFVSDTMRGPSPCLGRCRLLVLA